MTNENAPDRYAVVGNPVAHSRSPQIHAAFARQTGQRLEYGRILAPLDGFAATVAGFREAGGLGLNVTLPFKLEAFRLATRHTERAAAAGAVNTLRFAGGEVLGDNTDGAGLVSDLTRNLGLRLTGARVLLLGAGGAARGVVLPLLQQAVACLVVANRTAARARELEALFRAQGPVTGCGLDELAGRAFDVVVNATSAAVGDAAPDLPPGVHAPGSAAYEMMYGKGETAFLARARQAGATGLADGLGMLVEQAAESFLLWRGVRPDTAPVLAALREGRDP